MAADNGVEVIGVDINPHFVGTINKGQMHIVVPGLEEFYSQVIGKGSLQTVG